MISYESTPLIKMTEVKSKKVIKLIPSLLEMSHEEPSCHTVRKPSRPIKKPLLDVFIASAEVPVNNRHNCQTYEGTNSGDFISNMKLP